ncbi:MAG: TadG family pilus assembly protein [Rubripirellula sp.]|nr:TadG family pilus assembly protein [Rubripirellula sp.]
MKYLSPTVVRGHQQKSHLRSRHVGRKRRGAAAILGLFLTISLIILTAVALDFGRINVGQTEMKRSADAAAMAACWEMHDNRVASESTTVIHSAAAQAANEFASYNSIGEQAPIFNSSDIVLGTYGADQSWSTGDPSSYNAVRLTLRRQSGANGELPLFFGALTGRGSQSLSTTSTAAMFNTIVGFYEPPTSEETLGMLPIALDEPSWLAAIADATEDKYEFSNGTVSSGSDGIFETNLYPKGGGSPGNRGTVDIGAANNSTADLSRQVLYGISQQDFVDLGKPLEFDSNGELLLNGDTGISAGIKDELATLIGKTRMIPIFRSVANNGNNAMYTIVRFEGVRILDVKLTGKKSLKRVIVQPATVVARGAKIDTTGTHYSTHLVTPVMLVE